MLGAAGTLFTTRETGSMTDGNRLEELRSKIIASMGDKASQTGATGNVPQRYSGGSRAYTW